MKKGEKISNEFVSNTKAIDNYKKGWLLVISGFWIFLAISILTALIDMSSDVIGRFRSELSSLSFSCPEASRVFICFIRLYLSSIPYSHVISTPNIKEIGII